MDASQHTKHHLWINPFELTSTLYNIPIIEPRECGQSELLQNKQMPKKCPVRSLSDLALSELANTVVTTIATAFRCSATQPSGALIAVHDEVAAAILIVTVQSHLESLGATADVYEDLLRLILGADHLEAAVRFTCLQALLNGSVQALASEIFPFSYYEKILQVIAAQGAGLRVLNLKGVWVKEEHMPYMLAIVRQCRCLRRLCIPYIATDDLLEQIAGKDGPPELRYLDISGETDITDIGIERLCTATAARRADWLSVLDIGTLGEENVCHTDVAQLILHLPQLQSLVSYSYVGQSLVYVEENLADATFRCRLQYVHDTRTSERTMECIVRMCPQLESLYLDTPESGVLRRLGEELTTVSASASSALQRLKVHKFCCREFGELAEMPAVGGALVHVTLMKGRGALDLGRLARFCGALADLDLYMMDGLMYVGEREFPALGGLEMLSSPLSTAALRHFVCRAPKLQRLAVDQIGWNDDEMAR